MAIGWKLLLVWKLDFLPLLSTKIHTIFIARILKNNSIAVDILGGGDLDDKFSRESPIEIIRNETVSSGLNIAVIRRVESSVGRSSTTQFF